MNELAHTYFSLSLPQEISSVFYVEKSGVFRNSVNVNQIKVVGFLKGSPRLVFAKLSIYSFYQHN